MHKSVFFILLSVFATLGILHSCSLFKPSSGLKSSTYFPEKPSKAYNPKGYTARIIFPNQSGETIFVKGSESYNKVNLKGSEKTIFLEPPYYTSKIRSAKSDSIIVEFSGNSMNGEKAAITVYPMKESELKDTNNFSFLTFGCFQPFRIIDSTGTTLVNTYDKADYELRKFFYGLIVQKEFAYKDLDKNGNTDPGKEVILEQPKIILATGDQVYVDASSHSGANTKPISAWGISKNPKPLLSPSNYVAHLNEMYSHFWSFEYLEAACAKLPIISAIDDHEIRDGWGSQGDEYLKGSNDYEHLNPDLKPYFLSSRKAFAEHQLSTGPSPINYSEHNPNGDFHLEFESNGIPVFVFDLRSHRNINANTSINRKQMEDFRKWAKNLKNNKEVIIVSSLPLYWKIPFVFRQTSKINPELRDDIADFWSNDAYEAQRNEIFEILLAVRIEKNIKPIIFSGDVHVGSISEIWYSEENKDDGESEDKLLAYEMIVSGFAHENLSDQTFASQLNKMAASEGEIVSELQLEGKPDSFFELEGQFKISAAKLNFGAIEKDSSATFLHLFLKDEKNMSHIKIKADWEKTYKEEGGLLDLDIDDLFVAEDTSIHKSIIILE